MGNIVTQTVSYEKWPENKPVFEIPGDLFDCLYDLTQSGYRGQVRVWHQDDDPVWDLELNIGNDPAIVVLLGQVLVRFGGTLDAMTADRYAENFEGGASA